MARWLLVREYGAYSVSFSVLIVLAALHNALILEPMTVVAPAQFSGKLAAYFKANYRLNWFVSMALGLSGVFIAFIYRDPLLRRALLVVAAGLPGYVLLLTVRRRQYVLNRPVRALLLSMLYSLLVFGMICACRLTGRLSATTGVASFGMAWFAVFFLKTTPGHESVSFNAIAREHWRYGKWVFASALLAIGASDLQTLLLSMLVDLKAAGALRALMNFVLPLSQLLTVLSVYALPRLSSRAKMWGINKLLGKAILFPVAMAAMMTVYLGALLLLAPQFEHLLYAGKMQSYVRWMPLLAASAFVAGIGASFSTLLRAIQNSQHIFVAGIASTAVGLICALLLQRSMGIAGALWSLLAANTTTALVIVCTYLWMLRRKHA